MLKLTIILVLACCSECSPLRASDWGKSKSYIKEAVHFNKIGIRKSSLNISPCFCYYGIGDIGNSVINRRASSQVNINPQNEILTLNKFSGIFSKLVNYISSPHQQSDINSISLIRGESSGTRESCILGIKAHIPSIFHNLLSGQVGLDISSRADRDEGIGVEFPFIVFLLTTGENKDKKIKKVVS